MLCHHAEQTLKLLEQDLTTQMNQFAERLSDDESERNMIFQAIYSALWSKPKTFRERTFFRHTRLSVLRKGLRGEVSDALREAALGQFPEFDRNFSKRRDEGFDEIVLLYGTAYAIERSDAKADFDTDRSLQIRRADLTEFIRKKLSALPLDKRITADLHIKLLEAAEGNRKFFRVLRWLRRLIRSFALAATVSIAESLYENSKVAAHVRQIFDRLPSWLTNNDEIRKIGPMPYILSHSRLAKAFASIMMTFHSMKKDEWILAALVSLMYCFENDTTEYVSIRPRDAFKD
jgi:hypothetical protein